jgi:hypothetical protein
MRQELANQMHAIADAVVQRVPIATANLDALVDECLRKSPRFGEYTQNTIKQYGQLVAVVGTLGVET